MSVNLTITPEPIEVSELVKDVEALYKYMALQKELVFTTEVKKGLKAFADPVLINVVLRNLVGNAIKFTRKGGSVKIRAWQEQDQIFCSVADTGVGIKEEYLKQFKEDGYLNSSAGTDQEIGTGLGLQLINDLLKENNGTLEIESKTDVGSTFTFTLPKVNNDRDED